MKRYTVYSDTPGYYDDPDGDWVKAEDAAALLDAAKGVIAQFKGIVEHQDNLLVHGQTLESAAANWDEATLGQSIDFQPLIDAIAKVEG